MTHAEIPPNLLTKAPAKKGGKRNSKSPRIGGFKGLSKACVYTVALISGRRGVDV